MAKAFLGKTISPEDLRKAEKKDPELELARKRLEESKRKALNGKTIEDAEEVDDDD